MRAAVFAIRFLPDSGGNAVALAAYAEALEQISQGLDSLVHILSPRLAERVRLPAADVREFLRPAVLPVLRGSAVVPIVLGASAPVVPDIEGVRRSFWRYSGAVLKGAARQRTGVADVPASCAERFARASRVARDVGHAGLQLVEEAASASRPDDRWRPIVDLTRIEEGLNRYAERRTARRTVTTVLIGRVKAIVWDPPQVQLELSSGQTRTLALSTDQRREVREAWGTEVAVSVDANITLDGEIRDTPRVRKIEPTVRLEDLAHDFEHSFGAGRDVWGTKEAEEYLKGLRRDS
jgi:hypothetical protein